MIDASTFAHSYNAFWHAFAPTCEHFVRRLNLSGLERFFPPLPQSTMRNRRAVIAEFAFSLFVEQKRIWRTLGHPDVESVQNQRAWTETTRRLAPYVAQGLDIDSPMSEEDIEQAKVIAHRLGTFFNTSRSIVLRPVFPGCGYVDASEGDVIFGSTLYEVKTVERPIRSGDIRQTITYAALNAASASSEFKIESVGLFNPRRGQYFDLEIDHVCSEISGRPAQELFAVITQALSSGEISR